MKTNIKATHTKLTPAIRERVERICEKLEQLADLPDTNALECGIEVGKITEHHRKGDVYRAEINFTAAGKYFRAAAEGETEIAALDIANESLKRELSHRKHKEQSLLRRIGAQFKEWHRFASQEK